MAHIHFAWELGGELGHAGCIKALADEALRRGHQVSLSLRDLVHTDVLLAPLAAQGVPRLQAPVWLHQVQGLPSPQITLAEAMLGCGYLNANTLQGLFVGWRHLLEQLKPDLLVADSAPTALLAARSLGLRSVAIGIGYFLPPEATPTPLLRDWEPVQPGRQAHADAEMLASVNAVLQRVGTPPLRHAAQALLGDNPLRLTWPELDHYGGGTLPAGQRWWGPSMSEGVGLTPHWPAAATTGAPRVFAYLRASHPDHALVLQALVQLGCQVLCFMPEVASGKTPPVPSPLIHYAMDPVDLPAALPGCALFVGHGGAASLARALLCGVPALLLPTQGEQFLMCRAAGRAGLALNAAERRRPLDYTAAIRPLLDRAGSFHAAAQAFAQRHAGFTSAGHSAALVNEFERQIAAA
jgi:UDP:flavonoid glycosyltransferase YjiC (YdhE family)